MRVFLHVLFFNYKLCVYGESARSQEAHVRGMCVRRRAAPDCLLRLKKASVRTLRPSRLRVCILYQEQRNLHFLP
jgi:hypothetical protein